jgi:hypothetical protein
VNVSRRFTPCLTPREGGRYGGGVSIRVELDAVAEEVGRWGFGYLTTVSDDGRPHLLALTPTVVGDAPPVLRFDAGGGRACRNAAQRAHVAVMFPPASHSDGFSLVLDGSATVDGSFVDVEVTSALLHRPAP